MNPNGYQALRVRLHDGHFMYGFHLVTRINGKITAIWPEPDFTLSDMGDVPIRKEWLQRAQEIGAVDAEEFWSQMG